MPISATDSNTPMTLVDEAGPFAAGRVSAVRGAVLDVVFEEGPLPGVEDALWIVRDDGSRLTAEVEAHLGPTALRALALQSTAGLRGGGRAPRHGAGRSKCQWARRCSAACWT